MKILICASEVAPLVKTGGLGDVTGALPGALRRRGHDVRICMPLHGVLDRAKWRIRPALSPLGVPVGFGEKWGAVQQAVLPDTDVPIYFIEHEQYFGRLGLYQHDGRDYDDNAERYAFFARACCQLAKALHFAPDVIHCHDWHTALIPIFLKTWDAFHPLLRHAASVLSIHNVGYQGQFPREQIVHSQLGWERFTPDGLEHFGSVNYLKGGIYYADKVSTVSPAYAREIQTLAQGWSLDAALRARAPDLVGILNGCDYREWDPSADRFLPAPFDVDDLRGKAECKRVLQRTFGLPERPDVPVVGFVSRLVHQKGVDVLAAAIPAILALDLQLVVLGTGETWAHFFYGGLPNKYPGKAGVYVGFDDERAHRVYAGSDFFLMPSRYEPCGLSHLAAMRYGSLPIVRATGGLDDTVENFDEMMGQGTGFKLYDLTPSAIANTIAWAVSIYSTRPHLLGPVIRRAMQQRYLWSTAAEHYEDLYRWAIEKKRGP